MSNSDDQNWEDQWRNEMDGHAPLPTTEDWHGMARLLDRITPARAQHDIEQDPTGPIPWKIKKKPLPRLGWPIWISLLMLVAALGIWLGSINGEIVHQEMNAVLVARDSFPPNYVLNRYWTYDKEGNRVGEMHSDTIWMDRTVRKRGNYVLLSPGKVANYRIDTVLHLSGHGELQSVRLDTVRGNGARVRQNPGPNSHSKKAVYRFDTIYQLDTLGNLTDSIYSIDTTILNLPAGTI